MSGIPNSAGAAMDNGNPASLTAPPSGKSVAQPGNPQPARMGFTNPMQSTSNPNDIRSQIARQLLQKTLSGAFQQAQIR
jgi:hypothetical protein